MSAAKPDRKLRQKSKRRVNDQLRRRRLREDGRRPLAVNLAEGLALSEFVSTLPDAESLSDLEALEAFRADQRGGEGRD